MRVEGVWASGLGLLIYVRLRVQGSDWRLCYALFDFIEYLFYHRGHVICRTTSPPCPQFREQAGFVRFCFEYSLGPYLYS